MQDSTRIDGSAGRHLGSCVAAFDFCEGEGVVGFFVDPVRFVGFFQRGSRALHFEAGIVEAGG